MKNEKLHLIPQVIVDCVENLATTKQDDLRLNYIMRLEAIREYCDAALSASSRKPTFTNNNRSKKFSRVGLNNV